VAEKMADGDLFAFPVGQLRSLEVGVGGIIEGGDFPAVVELEDAECGEGLGQ